MFTPRDDQDILPILCSGITFDSVQGYAVLGSEPRISCVKVYMQIGSSIQIIPRKESANVLKLFFGTSNNSLNKI